MLLSPIENSVSLLTSISDDDAIYEGSDGEQGPVSSTDPTACAGLVDPGSFYETITYNASRLFSKSD
jgi:hypothetical protein